VKTADHVNWFWSILGSLTTAVAVISLVQRIGDIKLASLPALYLGYYRGVVATLTGWIPLPFGWKISQWYAGLMTLGAVLLLTLGRADKVAPLNPDESIVAYQRNLSKGRKILNDLRGVLVLAILVLLPPLALIFAGLIVLRSYYYWKEGGGELSFGRGWESKVQSLDAAARYWFKTLATLIVVVLVSTFVFFILNGVQ
jgi:hypothetical protein